ncbi:MAG: phosphatidylcholine/phosphatidylserine synthase [Sphingomonas sp.]|nr:phosphatidylcholine/phosphatidylserine synthase [Sphingomonas sp.]
MVEHKQPGTGSLAAAWGVHLFTSLGVVIAFLALLAIERQQPREALLWLFLALVVDGIDGTLARAAKVSERLPRIDGAALDLVIDYLTYVFLPVLIIWRGDYLPPALALPLCAAILSSSLYVFARRDMKTEDGYFRGFPALWNVVAFYFFVTQPDQAVSAIVVVALLIMTFAPVHVVHPFRAPGYGRLLPALSILWAVSTAALLLPHLDSGVGPVLAVVSLATAAVLIAIGLLRTARGARQAAQ